MTPLCEITCVNSFQEMIFTILLLSIGAIFSNLDRIINWSINWSKKIQEKIKISEEIE